MIGENAHSGPQAGANPGPVPRGGNGTCGLCGPPCLLYAALPGHTCPIAAAPQPYQPIAS